MEQDNLATEATSNIGEQTNSESSTPTNTTESVTQDSSTVDSNTAEATNDIRTSSDLRAYENAQKLKRDAAKQSKTEIKKTPTPDFGPIDKQLKELRELNNRQARELGELRKWKAEKGKVFDSYEGVLKQQQEQELLERFQSDPASAVKELAQRESQALLQPYAPIIAKAQAMEINSQLQQLSGEDYQTLAPVMADIVDEFLRIDEAQGTHYAQEIATQPQMLKAIARDFLEDANKKQNAQNAAKTQQKRSENLKIAAGVAKNNNTSSITPVDFSGLSLDQMRAQLKKQGIVK